MLLAQNGQVIVSFSRYGRLGRYMAYFGGNSAARRFGIQKEWLRFSIHMGFSHRAFPRVVFSLSSRPRHHDACYPIFFFNPDITYTRHIFAKFGHCLGFTLCFINFVLDNLYLVSYLLGAGLVPDALKIYYIIIIIII